MTTTIKCLDCTTETKAEWELRERQTNAVGVTSRRSGETQRALGTRKGRTMRRVSDDAADQGMVAAA